MRWKGRRQSSNVEDRRGGGSPGLGGRLGGVLRGGLGGRSGGRVGRRAGGGLGVIVIALVALYFGIDPSVVLQGTGGLAPQVEAPRRTADAPADPEQDRMAAFVSVVLADTEDSWHALFKEMGGQYREPKLVLFTGAVRSACGMGEAAMGPFYCPGDSKVYIDLAFYRDLKERHKAPGDFAQAYVIAHEVGHHVQNLLGISSKVHEARGRVGKAEGNQLSVRQELQADCLAGVWANHADRARSILEQGDVEEALRAASMIGDDRLQKQARGYVVPESFTHGTSEQRVRWFRRGMDGGKPDQCDTFNAAQL